MATESKSNAPTSGKVPGKINKIVPAKKKTASPNGMFIGPIPIESTRTATGYVLPTGTSVTPGVAPATDTFPAAGTPAGYEDSEDKKRRRQKFHDGKG